MTMLPRLLIRTVAIGVLGALSGTAVAQYAAPPPPPVLPPNFGRSQSQISPQSQGGVQLGFRCVTPRGPCSMSSAGQVGTGCSCFTANGPIPGQIAQ